MAAVAAVALPLSAGAADKTFVLLAKTLHNPFYDPAKEGCMVAAQEIGGIECVFMGPDSHDEAAQLQMMQDLVSRGVDGISVAPSNATAMAKFIDQAIEAGIPVVTFDSDSPDSKRASYIGTSNYEMGKELALMLKEYKPDGGTYAIISGGPDADNLNERIDGVRETLGDAYTEVDGSPYFSHDDFALSVQLMEDALTAHPDIDAIIPVGGWPHYAPQAYRQLIDQHIDRVKSGDLVLPVADTQEIQFVLLKEGYAHGLVGQRPYEMGYTSVYVLNDLTEGKEVEDPIYTGLDVVTPENVDDYLPQAGPKDKAE
jgi:ribose transport system substrate-binding protein